ncbi:MAG: M20/M25/M40 family metallo-hydrolase [Gordonia sp. (in: high G+C Gram-positive bacteria)]|uniref:M20/M25/M40 family metallo-hydrolase n=1 Tax=Gordonia sp. (in: high G+C Gram-positive bacteria) TaxID=84139 RepID=UPI0039E435FA
MTSVDDATSRRGLGIAGLLGALILVAVAVWAVLDTTPPDPVAADAPASDFSAQLAHRQIQQFATAPHSVGTAEHDRVRDYLVDHLRSLGLSPTVQEGIGVVPDGIGQVAGLIPVGRAQNIVTVIKGTASTGRLVLAAHYDSVPSGPGANDDGAGVSTILEVARALRAGPPPRNDIVLLITDAEEPGLLGADAYTHGLPAGGADGVVLNHESRGTSGPVLMFRSTPGSAALTKLYGDVAPHPTADSTSSTLFRLLPNGTDFTAFSAAGFTAMDSAYLDGGAHYHSAVDAPRYVDLRSLQQMGANTLAMTRALAAADLADYTRPGGDGVYFNLPPGLFVHFPAVWVWLLAALALLLTALVVLRLRASGEVTVRQIFWAIVALGFAAGIGALAGLAYWFLLRLIRPDFAILATPWRPLTMQFGGVAVAVAVLGIWYSIVRRLGTWALWSAALVSLTVLGVGAVAFSPQLAPLLLPAPFAALGGLIAHRASSTTGKAVALTLGLVPTAILLLAVGWMYFSVGLRDGMYLALPLMVLALVLMLPLVAAPTVERSRLRLVPITAAIVAVVLGVVGVRVNTPSPTQPSPARLAYVLDADKRQATWAAPIAQGEFGALDPWTERYVGRDTVANPAPDPSLPRARTGPAPVVDAAPPTLQILDDATVGAERTVRLRLASQRRAEGLVLAVDDPDRRVTAMRAAGRDLPVRPERDVVGMQMYAMTGPVDVELRFRAGAPLSVRLADVDQLASALTAVPGYTPPPEHLFLQYSRFTVTTARRL